MIKKQPSKQRLRSPQLGKIAFNLRDNQKGFTIIESLVAIVVVSILLAAIAPVIVISVATRVQARRVEFASQAARSYIDGIRSQGITAPVETGTSYTLSTYPAPTATGTLTCTANSYCTAPTGTSLYCLDFDNSGSCENTSVKDMVVQAFRYNLANSNTNSATTGYALGVRVYRADAFKTSAALLKSDSTTKRTQNTFTGGVGQRIAPLVEMTADISDIVPKYGDLCARFSGGCTN